MLLPFFIEAKYRMPDLLIEVIFLERRPFADLQKNVFLAREFSRIVDKIVFLDQSQGRPGVLARIERGVRTVKFIWRFFAAGRSCLLHSRGINSLFMRILFYITRLQGGKMYEHFNGLVLTMGRQPVRTYSGNEGDGFLCFSPLDFDFLKAAGRNKFIPIGYPRLLPRWLDRVRKEGTSYVQAEYEQETINSGQEIVSLFLGSTLEGLFGKDELLDWLRDAVSVVEEVLPDTLIFIKPHPMQDLEHLNRYLEQTGNPRVKITHLHPCLLASCSKFVIAHHTSTIIDALAMQTPVIQFQEFTDQWLARHPEGSSFLELGVSWARDKGELMAMVNRVISNRFSKPDIKNILHHKNNFEVVFEGIS